MAPLATSRDFLGTAARDTNASLAAVPLFNQGPVKASVRAKLYPAVFRVIRKIVVPTDRGAMCLTTTPVVSDYKDTIIARATCDTNGAGSNQVVGA